MHAPVSTRNRDRNRLLLGTLQLALPAGFAALQPELYLNTTFFQRLKAHLDKNDIH